LKQIGSAQVVAIRPPEAAAYWGHAFTPDGTAVYYATKSNDASSGALYRVATLGGAATRLLEGIDSTVGFSPDGSRIAFVRAGYPTKEESALIVANSDGSNARVVAKRHAPDSLSAIFFTGPSWSPDGTSIAFSALQTRGVETQTLIRVVPAAGGEEKDISNGRWGRVGQLAWLPDGKRLLAVAETPGRTGAQLWEIPFPSGAPRRITQDLLEYRIVSITRDGRSVVTIPSDAQSAIWSVPLDGAEPTRLTSGKGDGIWGFASLPDGRLVYTSRENGVSDIWVAAADGSERHSLFPNAVTRREPAVSEDGSTIAYVSASDSTLRLSDTINSLERARIDGSDVHALEQAELSGPAFTPDGKSIVYSRRTGGEKVLAKIAVDGGPVSMLTSYFAVAPAVSPDGRSIACVCREKQDEPFMMCILPIAGGAPIRKFPVRYDTALVIRWTGDGKALLFNGGPGDRANVYMQSLDGKPPTKLTHFTESIIFYFAPSRDGKSLLIARVNLIRDAVMISGFD
ncbi:MAG TPA: hypothetical protein VIM68_01955, partial [Thermoanaerobaculia bacterium]